MNTSGTSQVTCPVTDVVRPAPPIHSYSFWIGADANNGVLTTAVTFAAVPGGSHVSNRDVT